MKLVRKLPKYSLSFRFNQIPWNLSKILRLRRRKWSRTKVAKSFIIARFRKPQRIKHLRTYRTRTKKIFRRFFAPKLTDRQLKKLFRSNSRYKTTFKRVLKTEHRFDILVTRFFMLVDIEMGRTLIKQNYFLLNGKQCHSPRVVLEIGDLVSPSNIFTWTFLYKNLLNVTSSLRKYLNRLFLKFSSPFVLKRKKRLFREFGKYRRKNLKRILRKIRDRVSIRSTLKEYPIYKYKKEKIYAKSKVRPFPTKPFVDEPRDFDRRNIQYYIKSKLQITSSTYGPGFTKTRKLWKSHYFRGNKKFKFISKVQRALKNLNFIYGNKSRGYKRKTIKHLENKKFWDRLTRTRNALKKKRKFRKIRIVRNRAFQNKQHQMFFFNNLKLLRYKDEARYFKKRTDLNCKSNKIKLARMRTLISRTSKTIFGNLEREFFFTKNHKKRQKSLRIVNRPRKRNNAQYFRSLVKIKPRKKTKLLLSKAKRRRLALNAKGSDFFNPRSIKRPAPLRIDADLLNQTSLPKSLKIRRNVFDLKKLDILPYIKKSREKMIGPKEKPKKRVPEFIIKYCKKNIRKYKKVNRSFKYRAWFNLAYKARLPRLKEDLKVKKKPNLSFIRKRAFLLINKSKASIYKKRYMNKNIEITNPKLGFYSIFSKNNNSLDLVVHSENPRHIFKKGQATPTTSLPNLMWKKKKKPALKGWRKFQLIRPTSIWQMKRLNKKTTAAFYMKKKFNNQYLQFRNFRESKLVSWRVYNEHFGRLKFYTKSPYIYIKKTKRLKTEKPRGVLFLKQKVKASKIHSVFPFSKSNFRYSLKKKIMRVKRKYLRIKGFYKRYRKYKVECLFSVSDTPFDKIQIKYKKINLLYKHRPIPYYFAEMNYKTLEFTLVSDVDFLFFPYRTFLDYKTFASSYPNS
jgi:hypothetical protein